MSGELEFVFRFDVGHRAGAGHFMRQLALAEQAVQKGPTSMLLPSEADALRDKISTSIQCCPLPPMTPDAESQWLCEQLSSPSVVFVDSYELPASYYRTLAKHSFVVALEDGERDHPGDLVVKPRPRCESDAPETVRDDVLEGCEYIPVRKEFGRHAGTRANRTADKRTLLVCFGASDATGESQAILSRLPVQSAKTWRVVVVSGPLASRDHLHRLPLGELAAKGFDVEVTRDPDMASLISSVDAAITSAGSILWELATLGVATLALPIALNQERNARILRSLACIAGIDQLAEFLASEAMRSELSSRFSRLVDGSGAERVVSAAFSRAT